jgi:hypothetical protein
VPEKDREDIGIHFGRSAAAQLRLPPRHELLVVGKDETSRENLPTWGSGNNQRCYSLN